MLTKNQKVEERTRRFLSLRTSPAGTNKAQISIAKVEMDSNGVPTQGLMVCETASSTVFVNFYYNRSDEAEQFADMIISDFCALNGDEFVGYDKLTEMPKTDAFIVLAEPTETEDGYVNQDLISICKTKKQADTDWANYVETTEKRALKKKRKMEKKKAEMEESDISEIFL